MAIDFTTMDGYQFEDYISNLFRRLGFEVEATSYSNDGGVDLVATFRQPVFSGKYIIQCKNWTGPVGQPEVRDLYGVVMDQRANKGILITPSDYTQQAYDFANGKNIELINGPILRGLLTVDSENNKANVTPKRNDSFRNDRYSYYQKAILEEPNNVSNYLQMIEYLRSFVKEQKLEVCTIELFDDIIEWTEKLINRCFKSASKAEEKIMATMLKVEALIHIGRLAEATEVLLKCECLWIYHMSGVGHSHFAPASSPFSAPVGYARVPGKGRLLAWNLYVAFKQINYTRGCELLTSKANKKDICTGWFQENNYTTERMEKLFIYPTPIMSATGNGKTKHLDTTIFQEKDIKNPNYFFEKFYTKTATEYAQEIDTIFELHGML